VTYTADQLWAEVVYVSYYLHWPLRDVLAFEHPTRHRVINEIARVRQAEADELDGVAEYAERW
jgi:hypothetical protein